MMKLFLSILCIFVMTQAVAEDDDCVMNFKDFKSPLDEKSKMFKNISKPMRDENKHQVTQEAVLLSGEKLSYSGGGCAHVGFSYTYTGLTNKPKNLSDAFKLIQSLLQKTGFKDEDDKNIMLKTLDDKANKKPEKIQDIYMLKCGDADCQFNFAADKVDFSYSFAL